MRVITVKNLLLIPLAVVAAGSFTAPAGTGSPGSPAIPSHLRPHLYPHAPPALLEPLENDDKNVLKGWNVALERALRQAMSREGVRQRIVRIGVLEAGGLRLAAVKLQAGGWQTGEFSIKLLHSDALGTLAACFGAPVNCDHVDLWVAVPYAGPGGNKWHWPVFSLSCWRGNWQAVSNSQLSAADKLSALSLVRYDPVFLRFAVDRASTQLARGFQAPVPHINGNARGSQLPPAASPVQAFVRGPRNTNMVAITIDDGPHPVTTTLMLHILAQEHTRVTFFVVGQKILHYPQLLIDIAAAGHELGNHAFTNRRLPDLPPATARAELTETSRLIEALGRQRCSLVRPPGGEIDGRTLQLCKTLGLLPVFWSRNTGDWQPKPASDIVRAALAAVRGGDVILLHQGRPESALALREIILGLRQKGLEPGRVADILPYSPRLEGSAEAVLAQLHAMGCLKNE